MHETRRKTEKALRKNEDSLNKLEGSLRTQARDSDKYELVELLIKMNKREAERKYRSYRKLKGCFLDMALVSDTALQNLKLKKQEGSLMKVRHYEQIADRLISSSSELEGLLPLPQLPLLSRLTSTCLEEEREKLKSEYKLIKSQLKFHLMPLKQQDQVISWNSMILNGGNVPDPDFHLPEITKSENQTTGNLERERESKRT